MCLELCSIFIIVCGQIIIMGNFLHDLYTLSFIIIISDLAIVAYTIISHGCLNFFIIGAMNENRIKVALFALLVVISTVDGERSSTLFSSDVSNVSEGCRVAVQRLSTLQTTEPQLMAHYWDSWGKPSDSILTGHTTFLGYYDECMNLKNTDLGDMKYCIYPMIMDTNIMQRPSETEDGVCQSSNCPMPVNTSTVLNVKVGVCYPSACSANEFAIVLSKMNIRSVTTMTSDPFSDTTNTLTINLNITEDSPPFCPVTDEEYDAGTLAVIAVCVILVGLVVLGTTVDIILWLLPSVPSKNIKPAVDLKETKESSKPHSVATKDDRPTVKDFILAFSLYNTVPSLMMGTSPSALRALGAIKVFSNLIIVSLHLFYINGVFFPGTTHNSYLQEYIMRFNLQPIVNVTFAVECFFVVSGTLSAYLTFKDMEKHKRFRFKYFYLNRFFRLSPLFYLFTMIAYKLSTQFGRGPLWFTLDANACANTWWCNILYITNTRELLDMCIWVTWHISAEVHLFVFSPIFIVLLYRSCYIGLIAVGTMMLGATTLVGYLAATNGYWVGLYYNPQVLDQISYLHCQTFYRINSYLTGILLGYVLYKKFSIAALPIAKYLKQLIYILLWIIAIVLCFVTLYAPYLEYSLLYHYSQFENTIILMFSGLVWSIGIAIIIYICNTGYGGVVNSFLSWPGWEPLVKLSYGVALCHEMVIFFVAGTLQSGLKHTDTVYAMMLVFTMVLSYSVSAITAVFVERPIFNVVSLCFKLAGIETRSK